uniref:NADH dehydrogenase subunit 5 n=1 Tax=Anemia phyllitidis TaxID=12940 RepID=UPI0021AC30CB|nr:NADH dehydrogenase subunit 5 [Anemia phyllitidis]UUL71120.1 NADH dehydrogenase subunit 5 [Anemia phyllitidis]
MFTELSYEYVWIVPLCPFLTFGVIGLASSFFAKAARSPRRICAILSVLSLTIATIVSLTLFRQQVISHFTHQCTWFWVSSREVSLSLGFLVDSLTLIMSILVTTVGTLVMIYSDSYMRHDQGYVRFSAYSNLFTACMSGLVSSPNLIQIYIFWELVGMCSYLLIGSWFTRPSAANACQKAFVTNRVGDFGLLSGISGIYWVTGSFEIHELCDRLDESTKNGNTSLFFTNACAFLSFLGPVAKSAQFPLHVWLPDAMEGPTPISALIHAATMVAAGIFFVARMSRLYENVSLISGVISWIGGITALLGATIALAQKDIKKGLAYSTMSQLGYMVSALGIGAYQSALFHLITHAYSKALLFLGSGSVIHSLEKVIGYFPNKSQNMFFMGGLRKYMPITGITFLLGTLSLSGIPPLSRFWSKERIITETRLYSPFLGGIVLFTAGLTAFYMFRIYFLTFEGNSRLVGAVQVNPYVLSDPLFVWGDIQAVDMFDKQGNIDLVLNDKKIIYPDYQKDITIFNNKNTKTEVSVYSDFGSSPNIYLSIKESDFWMSLPLVILSIPTILAGYLEISISQKGVETTSLSDWSAPFITDSIYNEPNYGNDLIQVLSLGLALLGLSISYRIYGSKNVNSENYTTFLPNRRFRPITIFVNDWSNNRGYIDKYYEILISKNIRVLSKLISFVDQWIIDGAVNSTGILGLFAGEGAKYGGGGRVSYYLFSLIIGIILLVTAFFTAYAYSKISI